MYGANVYGSVPYGSGQSQGTVTFNASVLSISASIHAPAVAYDKRFAIAALNISATIQPPTVTIGKVFYADALNIEAALGVPSVAYDKKFAVDPLNISATIHDSSEESDEIVSDLSLVASLHAPTVTAQNREIIIKVNAVDISDQVAFDSLSVSSNLYSDPDTATFEILKSTSKSYIPTAGDEVEIIDTGTTIFKGLLVKISKEVNGFSESLYLEFKDWIEELGNILIAESYENMTVNDIIADINTNYLTGYDITNVSDTTVVNGITFDNISVVEALDQLAELSGKNWYVSPSKEIYFFADNGIQAPFDLTDTNGNYDYSSLKIEKDLTQIRNKVTVKGKGIAAVTVEDLTSQAAYGIREYFERDNEINATNEATQKANAILAAFKDPIIIGNFRTNLPGLFSGQQIDINSTIRGISETLNIETINFQAVSSVRFAYLVKVTSQRLGRIEDLFKKAQEEIDTSPSLGDQGFLQDIEFTAIDDETIQWSAGTLRLSDGTSYAIDANASQILTADHIIYFDPDTSVTALQISTSFADGLGFRKIPLAYATKNPVATRGADIFPVSFGGKIQLDGAVHITERSIIAENIAANAITANEIAASTITANEIAANTITAGKMNVSTLSAISANLGTITAGTITGALIQTAASGYRAVMTSANGFQLYNGATLVGTIKADTASSIIFDSTDNFYFIEDGTNWRGTLNEDGWNLPSGKAYQFASGRKFTDLSSRIECNGGFSSNQNNVDDLGTSSKPWANIYGNNIRGENYYSGDGSQGTTSSPGFVTAVQSSLAKFRTLTIKDGLITNVGSESGWL